MDDLYTLNGKDTIELSTETDEAKKVSSTCIGRVGAPPQKEATSRNFCFWIPQNRRVETTQIVTCTSDIAGEPCTYYGIVDEVYRQSRKHSMASEVDEADGDVNQQPPFKNDGITYAAVSILRSDAFTPPQERTIVNLANAEEARIAYGANEIDRPLEIGLIKNGANHVLGPGVIDLDYLLGVNGGHMNVNGSAGRGTKSSFLLYANWLLLHKARQEAQERPSSDDTLQIVPIILNVKGFDLFYIDQKSNRYQPDVHLADWQAMGIDHPEPFQNVTFYAPQVPGGDTAVPTGRTGTVQPYSWSLSEIIKENLFSYLFAEVDANDANFGALVLDIESWLTHVKTNNDGTISRSLNGTEGAPQTFRQLLDWVDKQGGIEKNTKWSNHHTATWKKFYRRLLKLVYECQGVLRIDEPQGKPLDVKRTQTSDPQVIDLFTLAGKPEIQRFVVATILRQLVEARTGTNAIKGLVYLVTLDELNRFAPRGANDAITRLIETVASEMRSQGIILFGAQQQASKVSEKVIENAALRVLGRTGTIELDTPAWRFLSASAKSKATVLPPEEKLIIQDNFREPMHVRIPFPVWAMNPHEAILPREAHIMPGSVEDEIATY
jgi:hypothetical protein